MCAVASPVELGWNKVRSPGNTVSPPACNSLHISLLLLLRFLVWSRAGTEITSGDDVVRREALLVFLPLESEWYASAGVRMSEDDLLTVLWLVMLHKFFYFIQL